VQLLLSLIVATGALAQTVPGDFKEVAFERLSDRSLGALGTRALAIRGNEWKHAETPHFVYHFFQSFVAAPVSVEAEFFYSIVAKELGRDTSQWERKCHVYVFERSADWAAFQTAGQLDPWTGGLCAGGELFIQRDPQVKWKGDTLGHEVTHLVLFRFFGAGVPLWLNEGFAEYAASRGYAAFWRARGFQARPRAQAVDPAHWIPLAELTSANTYPSDAAKVPAFYHESERVVRFLSAVDKAGFQRLLEALAQGNRFDTALGKGFAGKFSDLAALERAAKEYATREHGSALQDREP